MPTTEREAREAYDYLNGLYDGLLEVATGDEESDTQLILAKFKHTPSALAGLISVTVERLVRQEHVDEHEDSWTPRSGDDETRELLASAVGQRLKLNESERYSALGAWAMILVYVARSIVSLEQQARVLAWGVAIDIDYRRSRG